MEKLSQFARQVGKDIRDQLPDPKLARQIREDPESVSWPDLRRYVENKRWYSLDKRLAALEKRTDIDTAKVVDVIARNRADWNIVEALFTRLPVPVPYREMRAGLRHVKTHDQWKWMRAVIEKVDSVSFPEVIEDLNSEEVDSPISGFGVGFSLLFKPTIALKIRKRPTWEESQQISDPAIRNIVYMGISGMGIRQHAFLAGLHQKAESPENRGMPYVQLLEKETAKAYGEVVKDLKAERVLRRHSEEEVHAGSQKFAALVQNVLTEAEAVELKASGVGLEESLLTLYIRYGNGVEYGAAADALAICTDRYISDGFSEFFASVRAIPTKEGRSLDPDMASLLKKTSFVGVRGSAYRSLMKASAAVFTSHSKEEDCFLSVRSAGMKRPETENRDVILSPIELQETDWHPEIKDPGEFVRTSDIKTIIRAHFLTLLELDQRIRERIAGKA